MTATQPDINGELLFTLATTVALLRQQVRDKEQERATLQWKLSEAEKKRDEFQEWWIKARDGLDATEGSARLARQHASNYAERLMRLNAFAKDIEGHRDAAKTKAAKIALGHVVEMFRTAYDGPKEASE